MCGRMCGERLEDSEFPEGRRIRKGFQEEVS